MTGTAYVVGSGPAGVACARALLNQGVRVVMLDGGNRLEPHRAHAVEVLSNSRPEEFAPDLLALIKENMAASPEGVPLKVAFGSDFPYRGVDDYLPMVASNFSASPSLALGGLGNVWGASALPFLADDIAEWPITPADLAPHYRAVLSFVPLSAAHDALESILPIHTERSRPLRPSRQAAAFMEDLAANKQPLAAEGIIFGSSRLALRAEATEEGPGCSLCGLCMYGCPYGAIYNPAQTLAGLRNHPNFEYIEGVVVERVAEKGGTVHITATSMADGNGISFEAGRVYLAAGVLSTTRILLQSMDAYDISLSMKDSQYHLIPLLRYGMPGGIERERLHTLAQVYLEIHDEAISRHSIHLQVYSYNDLLPAAVGGFLGPLAGAAGPLVSQVVGRLLITMGYLHSDLSPETRVTLSPPGDGRRPVLRAEARRPEATDRAIKAVVGKLMKNRKYLRALPVGPMVKIGLAGRGYHSGSTFPMCDRPSEFQSDRLGRPSGFERVHAVDSTVLPSIPATTITLGVMANAHRIGSAHHDT